MENKFSTVKAALEIAKEITTRWEDNGNPEWDYENLRDALSYEEEMEIGYYCVSTDGSIGYIKYDETSVEWIYVAK